jgi:hypothetical protein
MLDHKDGVMACSDLVTAKVLGHICSYMKSGRLMLQGSVGT